MEKYLKVNQTSNLDVKMEDLPNGDSEGGKKSSNKRLSVERIYQKKTQLEHILLRPDTYIGSIERLNDQETWVFDEEDNCMKLKKLSYVPGLYKIFDEILVNAADNKQRDPKMSAIKIDIDRENNKIKVWNNGKGIPVVQHKTEKVHVPSLIFGHLLTSSNYDDTEKKVTGGRNGYGAKLCNIFSNKFTVETSCKEYGKHFKQSWSDNMSKAGEPKIAPSKGDDFTCITFQPDLKRFGMETLEEDICKVFRRRAYDIAGSVKGLKVFLNGEKLPINNFVDYVLLFLKADNDGKLKNCLLTTPKDFHCTQYKDAKNDRWEVYVAPSERGFQQMSFVNSIATTKGGRHVDYVTDQITKKLAEHVDKKKQNNKTAKKKETKKGDKKTDKKAVGIKPFQVKNHLWVFVNCQIENPTFDSQTKENMTLQAKSFGSKCELPETFMNRVIKTDVLANIMSWMAAKDKVELEKTGGGRNKKLKGINKLDDANMSKTKHSYNCTLILTEGDSAKTLAVAGVSELHKGRDWYGVFPLRGKLLNVREISNRVLSTNAEISDIVKIIGLDYKCKYDLDEEWKKLRYGKILIMTDQDQDGSHIKGLIINFIHSKWPGLIRRDFIEQFITPIIKVTKKSNKKKKISFYTIPEFEEWRTSTPNSQRWTVKYYKGLGTSTNDEAKEYFLDMERNRIQFYYTGSEDDANINLAFSKKKADERKEWLTNWMEERKRRRQLGLPDLYLYNKETKKVNFSEFINRELILFSNTDNERSIPSLVDGFKPGQRKVMFVCFKRKLTDEIKVSQLSGSVSEKSAYHHGEASLNMTIVGLAQNFVGSNNLNLLFPGGQFGSRLKMGKDFASPRYINTKLSKLARYVFNEKDDPLLTYNLDDNKKVEPEWYCPIIPMVLVNGADGIGTGWSTKVYNYDIREIVRNLLRMIDGEEPREMIPSWKNYRGTIEKLDETRYLNSGEIGVTDDDTGTLEITEIPIRLSTNQYREILEYLQTGEKKEEGKKKKNDDDDDDTPGDKKDKKKKDQPIIKEYKNHCDTDTVKFEVSMDPAKLQQTEAQGLHKVFKLQTTLSTSSMVLFDADGVLRRYDNVLDILREFFKVRLDLYEKRKQYMQGNLAAECLQLDNKVRFIAEKIDGIIVVENKKKADVVQVLVRRGYDPDPMDAWKKTQPNHGIGDDFEEGNKKKNDDDTDDDEDDDDEDDEDGKKKSNKKKKDSRFDYLLNMPIMSLTQERREKHIKNKSKKEDEQYKLQKTSIQDMWRNDLNAFLEELDKEEAAERKKISDRKEEARTKAAKSAKSAGGRGAAAKKFKDETKPSPYARRVEPRIDAALRLKVAAAAKSKLKAQNKKDALSRELLEDIKMEIDSDDDIGLNKSLSDRLGALKSEPLDIKPKVKQEKKPRKPRAPKDPTTKSPKKGKGKKKKKGNPWSDSEDDEDESFNEGFSSSDDDGGFTAPSAPRQTTSRRGATKSKYTFDDDSDADDSDGGAAMNANGRDADDDDNNSWKDHISDDSDFSPVKSSQETNVSKQSDSEPETEPDLWSRVLGKTADKKPESSRPKSPIFEKGKKQGADSDDDRLLNDDPFEIEPATKPPPAPAAKKTLGKKTAAPKPKKGKVDEKQPSIFAALNKAKSKDGGKKSKLSVIESDSDSDVQVTKSTIARNTKRPKTTIVSSDEDFMENNDKENVAFSANTEAKKYPAEKKKKNVKLTKSKTVTEPKPRAAPKRKNISIDSDSEKPKKKASPKKKAAAKKKDPWDSDASDGSDDDFPSKPAKKRGKKALDSDSEDEFKPKKPKAKAAKKKSADLSDEDDLDMDMDNIIPRAAGRARKQPVSYFNDSESDEDDF